MVLISRRMTCSFFNVTTFPNGLLLGTSSYFVGGGVIDSWENMYLYHGDLVGKVTNRERRHMGKKSPGHPGGGSPRRSWAYSLSWVSWL